MKKTIIIIMMALLGMSQMVAQEDEYEYVPFVREGVKWICQKFVTPTILDYYTLELKNDVEINGKTYKAMHKYSGDAINEDNDTIPVYLREENKVVYGIVPDGQILPDCPIGIEGGYNQDGTEAIPEMIEQIQNGEEFVLYDFNDPVGFIKGFHFPKTGPYTVITDTITMAGKPARRFIFLHSGSDYCMIDGIGYDGLLYGTPLSLTKKNIIAHLAKVIENGEVIYTSEYYKQRCINDTVLSIAREGVQWVNERVTVQNGVTTRSYYTYEFKGSNWRNQPICYQYTGDAFDEETATIAAKFKTPYGTKLPHIDHVFDNISYEKVVSEGRDMMAFMCGWPGVIPLYCWSSSYSDIDLTSPENYYIYFQREEILNRQNFTEVEPVEIEGVQCRRYAYVDESGEVQAYLVEGIGFDSRDMGDLLTPFTRKPDPDAEYQEWCGLSHVIKDGKIIYKGLRYNAAAVEGLTDELPGDVNDDGIVDISDVTTMIDLVLNGHQLYRAPADMDSDGSVDINDVTNLISIVLGNK